MVFTYLLAFTGLTLSAVAIYYSVIGLTAVFAAAFWPVVIMGTTLEVSKLVAASWLKMYWEKIPRTMKIYMTSAVVVLMLITSMGIFGFLSKAHLDQSMVSGDVVDKVAIIDEKIRTQKDNIEAARKALRQMDDAVDQTMARSTSEQGADKAAALRRQQQRERTNLQNDIAKAQTEIGRLNEQRAPIAKELRAVEAEVGPIKYIAKLIYGDNPDANILEKAVTWVIMIIVFVFDPLAVLMLLGAQMTWQWKKDEDQVVDEMASDLYEMNQPKDWLDEQADDLTKAFEDYPEKVIKKESNDPHPPGWMFRPVTGADTAPEKFGLTRNAEYKVVDDADDEEFDANAHARNHIPAEEQDIVDTVGLENWNKMVEEAEKAVEDEKERMRLWKEQNPDSTIKNEQLKKSVGAIDEVPWNKAEEDPSKKKTTYMIKDHNKQIKKTKD